MLCTKNTDLSFNIQVNVCFSRSARIVVRHFGPTHKFRKGFWYDYITVTGIGEDNTVFSTRAGKRHDLLKRIGSPIFSRQVF